MNRRGLVVAVVLLVVAVAGFGALLYRRAPAGHLTLIHRDGSSRIVPPGRFYLRPATGLVLVTPESGSFRFPADDSYRLFSRDGAPVPIVFEVGWRLEGDAAARRYAREQSGAARAAAFEEAALRAPLREAARPAAERFTLAEIGATAGDNVRQALADALANTPGIRYEIRVASFDRAAAEAQAGAPAPREGAADADGPRILFVGIDALDGRILDQLRAEGRLPHLDRLIRNGARADLRTLTPMLSPLIWTSIATGVGPDRHGILDFLVTDPATGRDIPATSTLRRAPALWNLATAYGRSTDLVGWLATWPAETIQGRLVSDRFGFLAYAAGAASETPQPDMVSPPGMLAELRRLATPPAGIGADRVRSYIHAENAEIEAARRGGFEKGNLVNNLVLTLATAETWTRIGEHFLARPARLTLVYYEFLDAVGHLAMPYAPPRLAWVPEADFRKYKDALPRAYEEMDGYLGRLLAAAGDSTLVMIASDHGFLSGDARPSGSAAIEGGEAARWHRDPGVLIVSGPGVRPGTTLPRAHVLDLAPTLLMLLDIPVSAELEGAPLGEAFLPEFAREHPVRRIPAYRLPPDVWAPPEAASGDSTKAWVNLGLVLEQRGRAGEAEALYRKALARTPDEPNALNNLGNVLRRQGRGPEAIAAFERLLARHPDYKPALQNLGACWLEADEPARALPWFDKALAAEPGNILARVNRGHARLRLGQEGPAEADFREALRLDPGQANAWFGLGLLAGGRGDLVGAREAFEKTLALDPRHAAARENLARIAADR